MSYEPKTQNPLHNMEPLPGVVCVQYVARGPNGNRCGPYYYRMWRLEGRLKKEYVRPEHVEEVRARCKAHQELQRAEREAYLAALKLRFEGNRQARELKKAQE